MEFKNLQDFKKLLSCADVSKIYKVSRNTVYVQCENGRIKDAVKTRGGWLIDPDCIKDFWELRQNKNDSH